MFIFYFELTILVCFLLSRRTESAEMNIYKSKQLTAADEVMFKLSKVITFPADIKSPNIMRYTALKDPFKQKMANKLKHLNQLHQNASKFENIQWKECEVGHYTGNQLLRALVAMCRDKDFFPPESGVVLTIDRKADAAVYFTHGYPIIASTSLGDPDRARFYDKIFDEKWCQQLKDNLYNREYFTEEKLATIRSKVPDSLRNFLQHQVRDTDPSYRHAFLGLLREIAKPEIPGGVIHQLTKTIPIATCVLLAVKNGSTHMLQGVFGDKFIATGNVVKEWKEEDPNLSTCDGLERLGEIKAEHRINAARSMFVRYVY